MSLRSSRKQKTPLVRHGKSNLLEKGRSRQVIVSSLIKRLSLFIDFMKALATILLDIEKMRF